MLQLLFCCTRNGNCKDITKIDKKVVAVIGDGAMTGGMAYEAMNNSGVLKTDLIVVLNDNNMSIAQTSGRFQIIY